MTNPTYTQDEVENPHFALPFRFGGKNGGAIVHEQDAPEEVLQCIEVLIAYPMGSHPTIPSFGTPDILFKSTAASTTNPDQLKTAILQWEERAAFDLDGNEFLTTEMVQQIVNKVGISGG